MRVKTGPARRRSKNRLFREAKGFVGGRRRLLRTMKESVVRARAYAYRDRKVRKREFRRLWITRINAATRLRGMRYSEFVNGMEKANIQLNRKMLSELAIHNPEVFDEIFEIVQAAKA